MEKPGASRLAAIDTIPAKAELVGVEKVFSASGRHTDVTRALGPISMTIAAQEFAVIVGPSGCGKTTLLNIFAGFERPSSGSAFCEGRPILAPGPDRLVAFQEDALFPWLTVWENVVYGPKTSGVPRAEYELAARRCLSIMGLEGFERHLPVELSGGMKQRVALARVLVMKPDVLLMDEPFGALDAQTRTLMQELLLKTRDEYRNTVLFITHDVDEAIFLADVVYIMSARPGQIRKRIVVPLERPRSLEVFTSDTFNAIKRDVLALIHEESIAAAMQEATHRRDRRR